MVTKKKINLDWEKTSDYYFECYEDLRKKTLFFVLAGGAIMLATIIDVLAMFVIFR
jgi:hypothetical protein